MIQTKGTVAAVSEPLAIASDRPTYMVDKVTGPERRRLSERPLCIGGRGCRRLTGPLRPIPLRTCRAARGRRLCPRVWWGGHRGMTATVRRV